MNTATANTAEPNGVWIVDTRKDPNDWLTEISQELIITIDHGDMGYTNTYDHSYLAGENLDSHQTILFDSRAL